MKRALLLALEFVALTAPLTWLWVSGGREWFSETVFIPVSGALYGLLGLDIVPVWRERFIHYVPFTALVLLTPRLGARRRLVGLVVGGAVMLACDVAINGIAQYGADRPVDLPMPLGVLSDALPFLVWAVIARDFIADLARRAGSMRPRGAPPREGPG